jgi:hypothetical protein
MTTVAVLPGPERRRRSPRDCLPATTKRAFAGGSGARMRALRAPAYARGRLPREDRWPPSSALLRACGCGPAVPALQDRHQGRDGRGLESSKKEIVMAQIGTFTRGEDGSYTGTIRHRISNRYRSSHATSTGRRMR